MGQSELTAIARWFELRFPISSRQGAPLQGFASLEGCWVAWINRFGFEPGDRCHTILLLVCKRCGIHASVRRVTRLKILRKSKDRPEGEAALLEKVSELPVGGKRCSSSARTCCRYDSGNSRF